MKFIALLLVLMLSAPSLAWAQDPCPETGPRKVCLPLEAHQAILTDLRELPPLRERVELLNEKLKLSAEQMRDMTFAKDLAVKAKQKAQRQLQAAVRGKRKAEESRDAWHRNRALWAAVGLVGALVIAISVDKIQSK